MTPEQEDQYYEALRQCGIRYANEMNFQIAGFLEDNQIVPENVHELDEFIFLFIDGVSKHMPLMKLNRWLGYIQGCMIERGYTTVEAERDWTRPLFQPIDFA